MSNKNTDKLNYLIKNIFITSTNSDNFNSIKLNNDINSININKNNANIN